jgi:hypothetical protein
VEKSSIDNIFFFEDIPSSYTLLLYKPTTSFSSTRFVRIQGPLKVSEIAAVFIIGCGMQSCAT